MGNRHKLLWRHLDSKKATCRTAYRPKGIQTKFPSFTCIVVMTKCLLIYLAQVPVVVQLSVQSHSKATSPGSYRLIRRVLR